MATNIFDDEHWPGAVVAQRPLEVQDPAPPELTLCTWGECWTGTKAQLQALGIGAGVAFPGEAGAARKVRTTDARGFAVEIATCRRDQFIAARYFRSAESRHAAAEERRRARTEALPGGVTLYRDDYGTDEFTGPANGLVALGLIRVDQLPGAPGVGKTQCTLDPSGTLRRRGYNGSARAPGVLFVRRLGSGAYRLEVTVSKAEREARHIDRRAFHAGQDALDLAAKLERDAMVHEIERGRRLTLDLSLRDLRAPGSSATRRMPSSWRVYTTAAPAAALPRTSTPLRLVGLTAKTE